MGLFRWLFGSDGDRFQSEDDKKRDDPSLWHVAQPGINYSQGRGGGCKYCGGSGVSYGGDGGTMPCRH